eukprot:TRINITY_DN47_c0_g1_i1.p1 TRINITY_DN47_c0_g1~~TRINITY_DN47_c0_g1_i1.p1  ORF type:complete len:282 (-),score=23.52 TRINITY_DN47_c0_g1_i1:605-1450(-)
MKNTALTASILIFILVFHSYHVFGVDSNARNQSNGEENPKVVAICFYGLIQRSLAFRIRGDRTNAWSGESRVERSLTNLKLMKFQQILIQPEEVVDKYLFLNHFQSYGLDVNWKELSHGSWDPLHNSLRQLYSLSQSWNIMNNYALAKNINYHAVILIRPDCYLDNPIDMNYTISDDVVYLPEYFSTYQYYDRFALTSMVGSYVLSQRIHYARHYCSNSGKPRTFHSETFLFEHMKEFGMKRLPYTLKQCRVRGNGRPEVTPYDDCPNYRSQRIVSRRKKS